MCIIFCVISLGVGYWLGATYFSKTCIRDAEIERLEDELDQVVDSASLRVIREALDMKKIGESDLGWEILQKYSDQL